MTKEAALGSHSPVIRRKGGLALLLRVTPNAKTDAIVGTRLWGDETRLLVKVRADAQDGKANDAALRLIARWLDLPVQDLTLASGARSRLKTVVAAGEPDALFRQVAERLDRL